jgi:hypothetical protein
MQTTKRRSAQAWREMVGWFTQSALTEEGFCEREWVSTKLFHRWRSKRSSATPRCVPVKAARVSSPTAGFVDLGPLKGEGLRLDVRA